MTNETQWEYCTRRVHNLFDAAVAAYLNEADQAGWELVIFDFQSGRAIFKRPKVEGAPNILPGERRPETPLTNDDVKWVVNEYGELGVRIHGQNHYLYKGESYTCEIFEPHADREKTRPMKWRIAGKREFGEVCYPLESRHADFLTNEKRQAYFEEYNVQFDWQEP